MSLHESSLDDDNVKYSRQEDVKSRVLIAMKRFVSWTSRMNDRRDAVMLKMTAEITDGGWSSPARSVSQSVGEVTVVPL